MGVGSKCILPLSRKCSLYDGGLFEGPYDALEVYGIKGREEEPDWIAFFEICFF